ncbi:MAG: 5'/3'-nucleotidase SurE, partial [Anaerolineae bacterium]
MERPEQPGYTILVTNDDGIASPGLRELANALAPLGEVFIIAPEHNWSASGHSKTMHKPLRVTPAHLSDGTPALATSGSPSDCVALALLGILERRPDLVVSGINQGANVGHDLTYSGTVSAAMEAVIGGIPAIAISLDSFESQSFTVAARFAAQLSARLLSEQLARPLLLNVNVPALPAEQIQGVEVTRLGSRVYRDELVHRADPRGRAYYWIGGEPPAGLPEDGTDIGALSR